MGTSGAAGSQAANLALNGTAAAPPATDPAVEDILMDRPGEVFVRRGAEKTRHEVPVDLVDMEGIVYLAAALKKSGTQVELHQYPDADHSGAVLESMKDSTPFLARVLA